MKRNAFTGIVSMCISLPFYRQVNLGNHRVGRLYKKKKKNIFMFALYRFKLKLPRCNF